MIVYYSNLVKRYLVFSYGLEISFGFLKFVILLVCINNLGIFNFGKGNGLFINLVEFLNGVILELYLICFVYVMVV